MYVSISVLVLVNAFTTGAQEALHNWGNNNLSGHICMEKNNISIYGVTVNWGEHVPPAYVIEVLEVSVKFGDGAALENLVNK